MKIAVFLPNWVGDAVMATPALRGLRDRYRHAEITAIVRPPIGDVLVGTGLVDRMVTWNPKSDDPSQRGWWLIRSLRRREFDLAVLLPNSLRSGWMAWCSGAKRRVGFARNGRGLLLTDALLPGPKRTPHPVIDEYNRLARHLGCEVSHRMELATTAEDEARLDAFLARVDGNLGVAGVERSEAPSTNAPGSLARSAGGSASLRPQPPLPLRTSVESEEGKRGKEQGKAGPGPRTPKYVCLNPGGAFGAAKHWPTGHFAELARRIATEQGRGVLVLCGPAEREIARTIARDANHPRVVSLAGETLSIGLTKAAVRRAELLVTTDSGPRHFAAPFDVPVVTLYGPTHIAWSETFYSKAIPLQIPVDCGPCQQRVCPLKHHRCMIELGVDRVMAAVDTLLGISRGVRAA